MRLFGYDNIYYEANSRYPFEELNESKFIERIFIHLIEILQDDFDGYDFYVFSNHDRNTVPESRLLDTRKKKVLLYFSDEQGEDPVHLSGQYFAIFKSYIPGVSSSPNVFPLPLGYVKGVDELPIQPVNERKHNVFFRGNLNVSRLPFYKSFSILGKLLPDNIPGKKFLIKWVVKWKNDYSQYFPQSIIWFNNSFKSGFSPSEYAGVLADSKVVLCPAGFSSAECFRHYEAMRAGCVIVSEKLPDNELYIGSPIIQIANWKEGLEITARLIREPLELQRIQEEVIVWWRDKWSEKATANFIISKLRDLA